MNAATLADGAVEIVRFTGSTSQVHAIEDWVAGGAYRHPVVMVRDYRHFLLATVDGERTVHPGDWIIRTPDGAFHITPAPGQEKPAS